MNKIGIGYNTARFASNQPHQTAIIFGEHHITYREFHQHVCQIQHHLLTYENHKDQHKVALLIGNEPVFLELFFAIAKLGWIAIPFDPKWSEQEAVQIMNNVQPDLIITSEQFTKDVPYHFTSTLPIENMKETIINTVDIPPAHNINKPFYVGFTSGSTGIPKGFIRNHQSWLTSFSAGEKVFQYNQNDRIIAPGPLSHSLSLYAAVHAIHSGATFYVTRSFSARSTYDLLNASKATVIYAVPTMLNGLAKQPHTVKQKVTILSSGSKLEPAIRKSLKKVFPTSDVYEYYGASELSFVTYATEQIMATYPHSVGMPFPGVQITIRNDAGEPLSTNQVGAIYIESPFLFNGYVHNPGATKEVLTQHGANIGDLGSMNEEGILTIVGRKENMIITGGLNVYPEEIENVIKQSNDVKDVVVLGIDNAHWGQKVIAIIQWKEKDTTAYKKIRRHCKSHLSIYKRPRKYYMVEEFPYTSTGKIARQEIESNIARWIK